MKNNELRNRVIAFNKAVKEKAEKATDMEILISELAKLPPGQFKKIVTGKVVSILAKYGVTLS